MLRVKLAVVGPIKAGKTTISNFLSDTSDSIGTEYVPTIGCRILEMEQEFKINNRNTKTEIELWDCSGDQKFEYCWPALSNDLDGVIFVYNPNDPTQAKDINIWYTHFVEQAGLRDSVCLVIVNKFTNDDLTTGKGEAKLSNLFNEIQKVEANMDESQAFISEFKAFLLKVATYTKSKQEQEEKLILQQR